MKKNDKHEVVAPLKEYTSVLSELKQQIQNARTNATFLVNKELIKLYWIIGKIIVEQQELYGWGTEVIENVAKDVQRMFPDVEGFSERNIFRMRLFYKAYEKVSQTVTEIDSLPIFNIPWGQNVVILTKVKNEIERVWYAQKSLEHGWSRSMLETWIESDLYAREGKAITNFKTTLPMPQSDMAQQSFKDPYIFDFLTLHKDHVERDLEQGLINDVQNLLLEMGKGFALIGRQYHLEIDEKDYYIDLLFYHVKLKCYVVVELKAREFDPRDVGQINFYLSAVDDRVKDAHDNPTIGLLLCKTKKNFTAEYALRNVTSPIGVAEYKMEIMKRLTKELQGSLPTIEEIEQELQKKELLEKLDKDIT